MTTRSTRRTVPLAIAGPALVFAWLVGASPRAMAAPAAVAPATASSAQAATPAVAPGTTQYAVKPGQSLADIAAAATQSHDKAVLSRAAKVIFDANPSAFSRGDPSLLKLGAVLNVPPLDETGALAKSAPEPAAAPAASSAPSAASTAAAASQAAAAGAKASGAQTAAPASAPAVAVSQASTGAGAAAPAKPVASPATHPQPNVPAAVAGGHAWSGAIESAPSAASSAPAEAAASATQESAAGAASAAAASQPAASGAATAGASTVAAASAAGKAGASAATAAAMAASHPKVSSLQQLLTLKNRVLMELQRHGFGTSSSSRSGATGNAPVGASGFAAAPPASGVVAPAPGPSRAAAAANQRFISVGGYGVARDDIPAIAAMAAAVAAALLVLLVALGMSRRKGRAPVASAASTGGAASAAPAAEESERAQPPAKPATPTDDPIEAEFLSILARNPTSKRALMGLAGRYAERGNVRGFDEIAQRIYRLSGGRGPNWVHVAALGRQLDPENSMFALPAAESDESGLAETPEGGAAEETTSEASASSEWPRADEPEQGPRAEAPVEHPPEGATVPELTDVIAQPQPGIEPEPQPELQAGPKPGPQPTSSPESTLAIETAPQAAQAPAAHSESEHEQELEAESGEPASASRPDATLPPEAVAALGALDFGLPPRAEPGPNASAPSHDMETHEQAGIEPAQSEPSPQVTAAAAPHEPHAESSAQHEPKANAAHEPEAAPAEPLAAPSVTGLGAAPVGPLKLSFNLDLPGADASEGAMAAAAPLPQFTPEQLAKIARNKLDLAAEYIALGDLGGARTLIHEVIESNDAATREDAHALLATLAPLS